MAARKFGALADLRQHSPAGDTEELAPLPSAANTPAEPARRPGRPPGKRSNPEWKLYSHFLKKRTQREAMVLLRADDESRDLSDVLQELLEEWLAGRRRV